MIQVKKLDRRYNKTKIYLATGKGEPVYRRRAFPYIDKVLGRQYRWINKSPEQYFGDDVYEEARLAFKILSFTGKESFRTIRKTYLLLSRGSNNEGFDGWHPDCGGHDRAFNILNHAYTIFKEANQNG